MLPVLIPLRDGHGIARPVLEGILSQNVPLEVVPVSRVGQAGNRRAGEGLCRNILLAVLSKLSSEVAVMMDRDVVLTDSAAFEAACLRLHADELLKVVHLRYKAEAGPEHYDLGAVVFKREVATQVMFDVTSRVCHCGKLTEHLNSLGWRQDYLSDAVQGQEYTYTRG